MKNSSAVTTMRRTAGVFYALLFLFQMYSLKYVIAYVAISDLPFSYLAEIIIGLGAAVFAAWLFTSKEEISYKVRSATVLATVLFVLYELLFYQAQTGAIFYTLQTAFPFTFFATEANAALLQMIMIIVRLLLAVLAVFFVTSARLVLVTEEAGDNEAYDGDADEDAEDGASSDEEIDEENDEADEKEED